MTINFMSEEKSYTNPVVGQIIQEEKNMQCIKTNNANWFEIIS